MHYHKNHCLEEWVKMHIIQAGAGIVADSIPEMEYQETLNKAKGLLKAIEVAERI